MRFFANLRYSYSIEHQLNKCYQKCWLETEFDFRFRLRFSRMIQLNQSKCEQRCSWCGTSAASAYRPGPRPARLYFNVFFRSVWRNIFGANITFFVQISPQFPLMFWWGWIPISSNANAQLLLRIAHVSNLDGTAQFCSRAEKKSISKKNKCLENTFRNWNYTLSWRFRSKTE